MLNHSQSHVCKQLRERVAAEPTAEPPGGATESYINSLVGIYRNRSDFYVGNVVPGQPLIEPEGVWRTHSTFHPETGKRRSADTLLDRSNKNLVIRTNAKVSRILFDGDIGVPMTAGYKVTGTPRARCVRLRSLEVVCVKAEGRIYVTSGAIHTPELLLKSGLGPEGRKVKNSNVSFVGILRAMLNATESYSPHYFCLLLDRSKSC